MADLTPRLIDTVQEDGVLRHIIYVDAVSQSRAGQKAKRLAQAKDFSKTNVVGIDDSGENAPPGFTKYEVIVTSVR